MLGRQYGFLFSVPGQAEGCGYMQGGFVTRWPAPTPRNWIERVNQPETATELEALPRSQPFGSAAWSPDSREIAFISTRDGGYDVYRTPAPSGIFSR